MNEQPIFEPDPIPAFRNFAYLLLVLMIIFPLISFYLPTHADVLLVLRSIYTFHALLLVLYLSSSWLQQRLGNIYLPGALVLAAFGSQLVQHINAWLAINVYMVDTATLPEGIAIARWMLVLTAVIVIAAWQYRIIRVIQFLLALGFFNLVIALTFLRGQLVTNLETAIAFAFVGTGALTIGYFVRLLSRAEYRQRRALADANIQLTHYATTLEQLTISRERNHIARELHDTVAHTLSGLAVQLETAKAYWETNPATAKALVEQSLDATRSGLTETRRALQSLRASPLEDLGLILALQGLVDSSSQRAGLCYRLELPKELPTLSFPIEQCIYRIAQEAIANVVKHSAAQNLVVVLTVVPQVRLLVQDDGKGFALDAVIQAGHYGLVGMQERAHLVGGVVTIMSAPGKGTTVQLVI